MSVQTKSDQEIIQELRQENTLLQDQIRRVLEMNEKLLAAMEQMNASKELLVTPQREGDSYSVCESYSSAVFTPHESEAQGNKSTVK